MLTFGSGQRALHATTLPNRRHLQLLRRRLCSATLGSVGISTTAAHHDRAICYVVPQPHVACTVAV